jgi:hypothetical protein
MKWENYGHTSAQSSALDGVPASPEKYKFHLFVEVF